MADLSEKERELLANDQQDRGRLGALEYAIETLEQVEVEDGNEEHFQTLREWRDELRDQIAKRAPSLEPLYAKAEPPGEDSNSGDLPDDEDVN